MQDHMKIKKYFFKLLFVQSQALKSIVIGDRKLKLLTQLFLKRFECTLLFKLQMISLMFVKLFIYDASVKFLTTSQRWEWLTLNKKQ